MGSAGEDLAGGFSAIDFSARETVVAAVSGGGDSLALLLLLQTHLQRVAPATKLAAVTVDHGLRAESATEAGQVAAFCAARGVVHAVLRWEGDKPRTGISAAAREARYRLLAQAAQKFGSGLVLTGHTRDDQAETVLMRRSRGEGRGLAGMAPATLLDGRIWVARPLLGSSREALRAFLHARSVAWIEDPGNLDRAYERVRARQEISAGADPEALRQELLSQAAEAAAQRASLGEQAAGIVRARAGQISPGLCRLDSGFAGEGNRLASLHALRLLLASIGGRDQLPEEARTAELLEMLARGPCRATLSGAVVDARRNGIFVHRELRGDGPPAIPVADGAIWDGRFRVSAPTGSIGGLFVAPLGRDRAAEAATPEGVAPASLIRAALAAQPEIHREAPDPGSADPRITLTPIVAPYARFLPCFDLAPAQALANLLGAPPFPRPPFTGHNAP